MKRYLYSLLSLLILYPLTSCQKKKYPPLLSAVSPTAAPIGTDITLTGSQFGDAPTVMLGSQTVPIKSHTESSIILTVPRMAIGSTTVKVQNSDGLSDPLPFTVQQPVPQLSSVEPTNGLPGTSVRIRGDFLDKLKTVRFGTTTAEVSGSGNATEITVKVPATNRGLVRLTVETEGGQNGADFIVAAMPEISGFSPKRVVVGSEVTIQGKYLLDGLVSVNGIAVDKAKTTVQDAQIKFTVPQNSTSGKLTVAVFDKLIATSTDELTVVSPLTITGFSPNTGVRGSEVTITGQNFEDVTEVKFSGGASSSAPIVAKTGTSIRVNVPNNAVDGKICLYSPLGNGCSAASYTVMLPPAIDRIEPMQGVAGAKLTVYGFNLSNLQELKMGDRTVSVDPGGDNGRVVITCPAFASVQTVPVTIKTTVGTSNAVNFKGAPKPVILPMQCIPAGLIPGSGLTLKGTDFNTVSQVRFPNATIPQSEFIRSSTNEVIVKVPIGASQGLVQIVNEFGASDGVTFGLVTGTGGNDLNTGSVGTGVTTIISTPISDECSPQNYMFCYEGKWAIYPIRDYPLTSTPSGFCRSSPYYSTEVIGTSTYQVYSLVRGPVAAPITLKFQLAANSTSFTGFVILTTPSGGYYIGNIIKEGLINAGDIIGVSPVNGSKIRLCYYKSTSSGNPASTGPACNICK